MIVHVMTYLTYYKSSTSNESSRYYHGEMDGAEPPVQKTTRSGQKTGHWPARSNPSNGDSLQVVLYVHRF